MSIIFKNNQEQKDYTWTRIRRYFPEFKTGGHYFRSYLKEDLKNSSVLVDAGCGSNGILAEFKDIPNLIIGIDINQESLDLNTIAAKKIIADLEQIPLGNNSADIVTSEFVLEHLKNPEKVFNEIFRILKPGGVFIFLTPNLFNPIMILSKLLPQTIHHLLKLKLLKKEEAHQTYYRANSKQQLLQLASTTGFIDCQIARAGNPEYLGFCKPLVTISIFFEKLISKKPLNFLQMYLIGRFEKKQLNLLPKPHTKATM